MERPLYCHLSTPTAVKVAEITPWIHHSRLKPAAAEWECVPDSSEPLKATLRKKTAAVPTDQEEDVSPLWSHRKLTSHAQLKPEDDVPSGWHP